eukprot:scaffold87850_cov58-Phaeocystis_antarctica.AAC.4
MRPTPEEYRRADSSLARQSGTSAAPAASVSIARDTLGANGTSRSVHVAENCTRQLKPWRNVAAPISHAPPPTASCHSCSVVVTSLLPDIAVASPSSSKETVDAAATAARMASPGSSPVLVEVSAVKRAKMPAPIMFFMRRDASASPAPGAACATEPPPLSWRRRDSAGEAACAKGVAPPLSLSNTTGCISSRARSLAARAGAAQLWTPRRRGLPNSAIVYFKRTTLRHFGISRDR